MDEIGEERRRECPVANGMDHTISSHVPLQRFVLQI
jgi:hypothetical protein